MPYFTQEYCDGLKGKTVELIEKMTSQDRQSIAIHWTDGAVTTIAACVEQRVITEQWTLIVNTEAEDHRYDRLTDLEQAFLGVLSVRTQMKLGGCQVGLKARKSTLYAKMRQVNYEACVPVRRDRVTGCGMGKLADEVVGEFMAMRGAD